MKKQLIKIKLNSLYGNHGYKGDVKNKVYFPTPVLFINYLLKHILLYADTDSVITIKGVNNGYYVFNNSVLCCYYGGYNNLLRRNKCRKEI